MLGRFTPCLTCLVLIFFWRARVVFAVVRGRSGAPFRYLPATSRTSLPAALPLPLFCVPVAMIAPASLASLLFPPCRARRRAALRLRRCRCGLRLAAVHAELVTCMQTLVFELVDL